MMKFDCEVAVIGAGAYGLSVASHLRAAKIETRLFGETMSFWRKHMPKGMKLRSQPSASNLADAKAELTFEAFAADQAWPRTGPISREMFVAYGEWFTQKTEADPDPRMIERVDRLGDGFCLWLDDGGLATAQRVVVAAGLGKQEFRPAVFTGLPRDHVSFVSEQPEVSVFRGKRVAVIGRGQSACEYAALLNEAGADVELISRGEVRWLGSATADQPEDLIWRLHKRLATRSGVGPFPINWLVEAPGMVQLLPPLLRHMINTRCLRSGAASWLKPGFAGVKTDSSTRNIREARVDGSKVLLRFDRGLSEYDHVVLATGYCINIAKLNLFAPHLLQGIRCINGSPELSRGLQCSVPNLHFAGSAAVMSYGPLMRFIAGSGYAARHLTQYIRPPHAVGRSITIGGTSIVATATGMISKK